MLCIDMCIKDANVAYIIWQNRALDFYLAARLCYLSQLYRAAAFLANQTIETLMKATLIYWDKSFVPEDAGHAIKKMINMVRNKVKGQTKFDIPEDFYFEQRYQSVSRYPKDGNGLGISSTFIEDLDHTFVELISMVPLQFNSELLHTISGKNSRELACLRRSNSQMRRLRKILGAKLIRKA